MFRLTFLMSFHDDAHTFLLLENPINICVFFHLVHLRKQRKIKKEFVWEAISNVSKPTILNYLVLDKTIHFSDVNYIGETLRTASSMHVGVGLHIQMFFLEEYLVCLRCCTL